MRGQSNDARLPYKAYGNSVEPVIFSANGYVVVMSHLYSYDHSYHHY